RIVRQTQGNTPSSINASSDVDQSACLGLQDGDEIKGVDETLVLLSFGRSQRAGRAFLGQRIEQRLCVVVDSIVRDRTRHFGREAAAHGIKDAIENLDFCTHGVILPEMRDSENASRSPFSRAYHTSR